MNGGRIAPMLVALLCITAIGVSATTLDSTLTTDPDEEINPEYELLPIGQDEAFHIQQQMDGTSPDEPSDGEDSEPADGSGGDPTDLEEADGEGDGESAPGDADDGDGGTAAGDEGTGPGGGGTGTGPGTPDLLDRLLALLLAVLRVLVPLLAVLSLVALVARYRERIAATIVALLAADEPLERGPESVETWPAASPTNPVDRAWLTMVRQVDPARPAVMTPSECAAAARDAGLDPEAVAAITDAFERVHYGGCPASTEVDRARKGLRRLQNADGGRSSGDHRRPEGEEAP